MFLLVMIFNSIIISKYKLIDLLTAGKKNEDIKIKKSNNLSIIFILGIIILGTAYYLVTKSRIKYTDKLGFKLSIVFGIIGTVLFFFRISGFLLGNYKE